VVEMLKLEAYQPFTMTSCNLGLAIKATCQILETNHLVITIFFGKTFDGSYHES